MSNARANILGRLTAACEGIPVHPSDFAPIEAKSWSAGEKLERLQRLMEAVHTEFLDARGTDWRDAVASWLSSQNVGSLLYGPDSAVGRALADHWTGAARLVPYDRGMDEMKETLFNGIDASVTATRGAIAETGSLILWPGIEEPRTMSLVPPIHIALLAPGTIVNTLREAMLSQSWAAGMPTNALLISGPSKTADIEQTLAYGVHGPKRLLVVLVDAVP